MASTLQKITARVIEVLKKKKKANLTKKQSRCFSSLTSLAPSSKPTCRNFSCWHQEEQTEARRQTNDRELRSRTQSEPRSGGSFIRAGLRSAVRAISAGKHAAHARTHARTLVPSPEAAGAAQHPAPPAAAPSLLEPRRT